MTKTKKLVAILTSLLLASCSNITPDQITSISNIIKSTGPSSSSSPSASAIAKIVSLDGTVFDANSNTRLIGATIKINGQTVVTDPTGHYYLSDLFSGSITVSISKDGYDTITEVHELKEKAETINFKIKERTSSLPLIAQPVSNIVKVMPTTKPINTPIPAISSSSVTSTPVPIITSVPKVKTSLSGYLREEITGKPLPSIVLKIADIIEITDSNGYFSFPDIPSGNQVFYEYLNGLDRTPITNNVLIPVGNNTVSLTYYVVKPIPTPTMNNNTSNPTPTPLPTPTPTEVPTPEPIPTPTDTPLPKSVLKSRDNLVGIWEFTFTSKKTSETSKSIIAFRNSTNLSTVFYAAKILDEDKQDALDGKVKASYLVEANVNSSKYNGTWDTYGEYFFMVYAYYQSPLLYLGQNVSYIRPLIATDKDTLEGTENRIVNDVYLGDFTFTAKRLRDNFSSINENGTVSETYTASY